MSEGEWVSITDAAKRLTSSGDKVARSTLSRYLKKHSEALEARIHERTKMVNYPVLTAHRLENIRLPNASIDSTTLNPDADEKTKFAGTQINGAARKSMADATMRELDLAERQSQLTPVNEVDNAGRNAVALMRSAFDRAVEGEAVGLSLKYGWDEKCVKLALKVFAKSGIDIFHREILSRIDAMNRDKNSRAASDETVDYSDEHALQ